MDETCPAVAVSNYESRGCEVEKEFSSSNPEEILAKNDIYNRDTSTNLCTHSSKEESDVSGGVVLDVAYQFKEKLNVGLKSQLPVNGCVLNHENGMVKLDSSYQDSNRYSVDKVDGTSSQLSPCSSEKKKEVNSTCENVSCVKNCANCPSIEKQVFIINTNPSISYVSYESEFQMPDIMRLIQKDLSEPYSIYTYRYFIHNWPKLCFLAMDGEKCVGAIVCKLDLHKKIVRRGYIAMLAVDENYRKRKIGSNLVLKAIRAMVADDADEVVLETEITNKPALRLYENLGFVRDKRLFRYYLNGVDALRLKLWLR